MEELIERIAALDIVEERLYGNPSAGKHWSTTKNVWVAVEDRCLGSHCRVFLRALSIQRVRFPGASRIGFHPHCHDERVGRQRGLSADKPHLDEAAWLRRRNALRIVRLREWERDTLSRLTSKAHRVGSLWRLSGSPRLGRVGSSARCASRPVNARDYDREAF